MRTELTRQYVLERIRAHPGITVPELTAEYVPNMGYIYDYTRTRAAAYAKSLEKRGLVMAIKNEKGWNMWYPI